MSRLPVVGIEVDLEANAKGRRYAKCYETYFDAVSAAGAAPVLLPPAEPDRLREVLSRLDGVVMPGGDDLAAEEWGEVQRPCPRFVAADPRRLAHGKELLGLILELELPFLGVCYGAQLLNLALGGTMHQDIPDEFAQPLVHSGSPHPVEVLPETLLAELVGAGPLEVNSRHHQANRAPGRGLRVSAVAADGVVEAVEAAAPGRFLLGVQWHPEDLDSAAGRNLFRGLVEAARRRAAAR